jgi:protein-histidine pros-kinase
VSPPPPPAITDAWDAYFRISADGMAVTDRSGLLLGANGAMEALTGFAEADLVGARFDVFVSPGRADADLALFAALVNGDSPTIFAETCLVAADGAEIPVGVRATRLSEVGTVGGLMIVAKFEDLRPRNQMLEALARAAENQAELLSRTSHELRTPLHAISGYAQLLAAEDLPPKAAEMVALITAGAADLRHLIDSLLDLTRSDYGADVHLVRVPLAPVVSEVIGELRPVSHATGVVVTTDIGGAVVMAERSRLRNVILNLVTNAVTYNAPGGTVHVSAEYVDGRVNLVVHDTGTGMDANDLALAFEPFHRGSHHPGAIGTGLGLTIAKSNVARMGGTIDAESVLGSGSTFSVRLLSAAEQTSPANARYISPVETD